MKINFNQNSFRTMKIDFDKKPKKNIKIHVGQKIENFNRFF